MMWAFGLFLFLFLFLEGETKIFTKRSFHGEKQHGHLKEFSLLFSAHGLAPYVGNTTIINCLPWIRG